jgi:hypothetical protein
MTDQRTLTKVLAVVFAIAGVIWIIGGIVSISHFVLYPFIGLINLGLAYYCKKTSA